MMRKLTKADLPAIYPIFFTVFPRRGKKKIDGSLDAAIAALLEIEEKPFRTSLDAAYDLLDMLVAGDEYTNVDYREYRDNGYILCDINDDTDYTDFRGNGNGATRIEALFQAIVSGLTSRVETIGDESE